MYKTCSKLVVFMYRTGKSMNNILSYCGLVDARIRASNKVIPVQLLYYKKVLLLLWCICAQIYDFRAKHEIMKRLDNFTKKSKPKKNSTKLNEHGFYEVGLEK